jgi:tRNA (cytidine/uridine-2'-O-)-methyltransferase
MPHDLHIVLVEPEIPQNTGSVGRLCLAIGATLHLVEPLGFDISDSAVKRAGLDYWEHLKVVKHASIDSFLETLPKEAHLAFLSKKAGHTIYTYHYRPSMYLLFGKETAGLPEWLINKYPECILRIPMYDARVRSLNLATSVGIVAYEAVRQLEARG